MHRKKTSEKLSSSLKTDPSLWLKYFIEPATLERVFDDVKRKLAEVKDQKQLVTIANYVAESMDSLWAELEPEQPEYACRKGCSWCCHQNVSVTWPELLKILTHIVEKNTKENTIAFLDYIKVYAEKIAGKSSNRRFDEKLACAFLADNRCTIHSVRPLQCRGGFSEKEKYCQDLLEDRTNTQNKVRKNDKIGKYLVAPKLIYNSAQVGMSLALKNANFNSAMYELTAAMAILLEQVKNEGLDGLNPDELTAASFKESTGQYVAQTRKTYS